MTAISNTVSTFIESQLPEFIRDDNPAFTQFVKSYYEWMEKSNSSAVIAESKKLLSYKDIDQTTDDFLQYYINDFLPHFPNDVVLDERKLVKAAREFYQKKGSIESIQFLFRVLYGKEAQIFFPKDQILKASDGKWTQPQALKILLSPAHESFDVSQLVGRQGLGAVSNASCVIEAADKVIDSSLGFEIVQLYISNLNQDFSDLENLNVLYGYDANNNPLIFSEKIIASISNIKIDSKNRGLKYKGLTRDGLGNITYAGDPVVITGGLASGDTSARKAEAYVGNVTSGSITDVVASFGGYNYRVYPNTVIKVINDPSDTTGIGANVIIQAIDSVNSTFILLNTDSIKFKQNAVLSSANFAFSNMALANITSQLSQAFAYENVQFAAITSMNVINGGGGYTATPSINLAVSYYSDYDRALALTPDLPNLANNLVYIQDLGYIANVTVVNGGSGYSNVTDKIVVPSAIGYGAVFDFITVGNVITSVLITNKGEGYIQLPMSLIVANSANVQNTSAGANAQLVAYGFGQGAQLNVQVNQIGQITDFRIVSRGFDYVSTPNVSLRIQDFKIVDPGSNLSFVSDEIIFQGANSNSASYRANIDSYNVATKTLRTYNYQGSLNVSANLRTVISSQNVSLNTLANSYVTTYGNGKAKANAIFQNGLIQENGFYLTTDGFLSSDMYLQDSNTYHNFSYMVVVEKALMDYKNTLMELVHPSGTSMLGRFSVETFQSPGMNVYSDLDTVPVPAGSVSANAFGYFSVNNSVTDVNVASGNWSAVSSTTSAISPIPAPDGSLTAYRVSSGVTNAQHGLIYNPIILLLGNVYTISVYAKAMEESVIGLAMGYNSGGSSFNLSSQSVSNNPPYGTGATITPLANGWFRCSTQLTPGVNTQLFITMGTPGSAYVGFGNVAIWGPQVIQGNTTPIPYYDVYGVSGSGTNFGTVGVANDFISFNTSDSTRALQTKRIVSVINTSYVLVESNTSFTYINLGSVVNGANTIIANGAFGSIAVNDILKTNVAGNAQTSIVQVVSANTISVNTIFSSNATNVVIQVFPSINTASYSILRTNP